MTDSCRFDRIKAYSERREDSAETLYDTILDGYGKRISELIHTAKDARKFKLDVRIGNNDFSFDLSRYDDYCMQYCLNVNCPEPLKPFVIVLSETYRGDKSEAVFLYKTVYDSCNPYHFENRWEKRNLKAEDIDRLKFFIDKFEAFEQEYYAKLDALIEQEENIGKNKDTKTKTERE